MVHPGSRVLEQAWLFRVSVFDVLLLAALRFRHQQITRLYVIVIAHARNRAPPKNHTCSVSEQADVVQRARERQGWR